MIVRSKPCPFCVTTWLATAAFLLLLTPAAIAPLRAENAQQATLSEAGKSDNAKPVAVAAENANGRMTPCRRRLGQAKQYQAQRRASPKRRSRRSSRSQVRQAIFSAACRAWRPRAPPRALGSLPHVARKLAAGEPVVIIAFGSSSTAGYGTSSPEFTYPNRLSAQLHRKYPGADITVINRGRGGEDAPEMMKRLQTEVLDAKPDMVIWQVGTNAILPQPRSRCDRADGAGWRRPYSGRRRRSRAGRSAIFSSRSPSIRKARARWSGF